MRRHADVQILQHVLHFYDLATHPAAQLYQLFVDTLQLCHFHAWHDRVLVMQNAVMEAQIA